jgi:hypothetical protein
MARRSRVGALFSLQGGKGLPGYGGRRASHQQFLAPIFSRTSLTILAAFEALVGLLIEVTFIATLTRRLFGK